MIVVAGLIVAFILLLLFSRPQLRACRWRADHRGDRPGHARFRCAACGAVAFTKDGKPPLVCHKIQPPQE